jgi:hypothetical protein
MRVLIRSEETVQVQAPVEVVAAKPADICTSLPEDKATSCRIIVEDHADMKLSTREAEEKLTSIFGEEIKLVEEPDWKLLPQDPPVLEAWAMSVCQMYSKGDQEMDTQCVDQIDKVVKRETSLQEAAKKIGAMMREDANEIEKTIMTTAPQIG